MIHITQEKFYETLLPPAWAPRIVDFGMVYVDLDNDQPPYVGIIFRLRHPSMPEFEQLIKLGLDELTPFIRALEGQRAHRDALQGEHDVDPPHSPI